MKKKLVVLLSVLLVATNCMYVSAAPVTGVGDSDIVIVDEQTSEDPSEEEVSEEELSEEISEEEVSEEISEEESEEKSEEASEEESEEENSEETDSEDSSEVMDFDDKEIKNIDNTDDEIFDLNEVSGYFEYEVYGWGSDKYVEITKYTGSQTTVTVPDKIANLPVKEIGSNAFFGKSVIQKVILPSTITKIEYQAFGNCSGLKTIELKEGLQLIGQQAFVNCVQLTSVTIPSTVKDIGYGAYEKCSGITSITIKNSFIGHGMFYGCTGLSSVKIPATVTSIGNYAFQDCTGLKSAVIEANGTIGTGAFENCPLLATVTLKNVKEIEGAAFKKTGIKTIDIPATVTAIGPSAFDSCKSMTAVTLHEGLKKIDYEAFYQCISLQKIAIPSTVTYNGYGVFYECKSLASATIKGTSVSSGMFYGCTALTEITVPATVSGIGQSAFENCTSLKKAVIKSSGAIGTSAFLGCSSLATVNMQDSLVTSINYMAFSGTPITAVKLPNTVIEVGYEAFYNCKKLKTATLNQGLSALGYGAFMNCTSLQAIIVPSTVNSVGMNCFAGCTSLIDIAIKNTTVSSYMFDGCTSLKRIVYPETVLEFGYRSFHGCSSLQAAMFMGNPPPTFEEEVFSSCSSKFEIQYLKGKTGWTNPWKGYKTKQVTKFTGNAYEIFEDIMPGDWSNDYVQFVYDKGLMEGTAKNVFGVNSQVKREQVVQVLYANEGKPAVTGSVNFKDVKTTDWFYKAVVWAKNNGISQGNKDGTFGVGNNITREALALMLYKYAQLKHIKTAVTPGASDGYADSSKISSYAKTAMDWAITQGIMSGKGGNRLDPTGKATRAEFAVMLKKLLQ